MGFIITHSLFACCILAFYFVWNAYKKLDMHYIENKLFLFTGIGSGIWSLGFYGIMIQTDDNKAYYWRLVGMAGVFLFLIFVTLLVTIIADMNKTIRRIIYGYSCLGIVLYFGLSQKKLVVYNKSFFGMTYSFLPSVWNSLYTIYSIILAIIMTISLIWLLKTTTKKRLKVLAKKMILADFIVATGMIFDTILPALGIPALPGSTFGQFIGLIVLYNAIFFINKSRIEVDNISKFIYYSLDLPVLLFDSDKKLHLANNCADIFFDFWDSNLEKYTIDNLFEVEPGVFSFEEKRKETTATCIANQTQCNLSINKVFDDFEDIIGYIVFVNDMTEHLKTIDKLEEAIADADRANKSKSIFLANMSQEIRTPIHAIIGFSELVLKSDISSQVRGYIEDIKLSSNNLLAIINDILDISKIESGKMELVPSNYYTSSLIKDVLLIVTTQAEGKGLNFAVDVDENLPNQMFGDKVRLRGVIINLLNNAVKYTESGEVCFTAKIKKKEDNIIWLEFIISDTGIGIKQEDLPNLFKKFERLDIKNNYNVEGSGLGLSISNGYIQLMGGEIHVNSVYGKGSEFKVIVPQKVIDEKPFDKKYMYSKDEYNSSERFRVDSIEMLVVDDNKINLRMAQGLFGSYGFKVDVVDSGQKAIDICSTKCYPLVFMDQMMPNIDGVTAMKEIRKINPYYYPGNEGKIIVLTADAISGVRERLINEGFDEYIGKPFDVKKLENLFLRLIPREQIIYDSIESKNKDYESEEFISQLSAKLPRLNIISGLSYCDNNVNEYLEILKLAVEYGEEQINNLKKYKETKDYNNYTILVHSLKSNAKNIGADNIANLAQQLETHGKCEDYSYIDDNSEQLLNAYHDVLQDITMVLTDYGIVSKPKDTSCDQDNLECLDAQTISVLLDNILVYIEQFKFDSIFELLDDIKDCTLTNSDKKLFEQINESMQILDIDNVKSIINTVL